jgi:DNA-binding NarL/FixJ family response regulator
VSGSHFVVRDGEMESALRALGPQSEFRGVALVGGLGVGKTTLARALATTLAGRGLTPCFVNGTEAEKTVPLAAFGAHVGVEALHGGHAPAARLAAARSALTRHDALLLVVDDAHLLDGLSAVLVHQIAASTAMPLIVTLRSGAPRPDAITALWKERLIARIDLEPMTATQTADLARAVLGGDLDSSLAAHLQDFTAGNPLALRSVLATTRADRALVYENSRWQLRGPLRVGADLADLVEARLAALDPQERDVIEIVCMAGRLEWGILQMMCDADVVARAERHAAIRFAGEGPYSIVQPTHRVLAEVVRARCGAARTHDINTRIAQAISAYVRAEADGRQIDARTRIQWAQLMTRAAAPPDIDVIIAAASTAVALPDLAVGEELGRFAHQRSRSPRAALVLAEALSWSGRGTEAEAILAGCEPVGDDALLARWGCIRAANLFFGCALPEAASETLAEVRARLSGSEQSTLLDALQISFAACRADVGRAAHDGLLALKAELPSAGVVWAAVGTALALTVSGRFGEVSSVCAAAMRTAEVCEAGPQRFWLEFAAVCSAAAAGRFDDAEQARFDDRDRSLDSTSGNAVAAALAGYVALARGDGAAARDSLRQALPALTQSLPGGWVVLAAAWLARAEALRGDVPAAEAALAQADAFTGSHVLVFMPELQLARAWVHAAAGRLVDARQLALDTAAAARGSAMSAVELVALHTAARFGQRLNAVRLATIAVEIDNPLSAAMALHAQGVGHGDPDQMAAAADAMAAIGAMDMAADAWAGAAVGYARSGARVRELECRARALWLADRWELQTPAIVSVPEPLALTAREGEIADLVGEGLTNRQIAGHLELSVRTIEGHLHRIFAKLRIEQRSQLARIVRLRAGA